MEATMEMFFPLFAVFKDPVFWRKVLTVFVCLVLATALVGCSIAQVQTVVQQIISDMPTILNIIGSVVAVVGVAKGLTPAQLASLQAVSTNFTNQASADLSLIKTILSSYQNGLGTAPPRVITQLDSAVAAVTSNLTALEAAFHIADPRTQASVGVVVAAVSAFLLGVTSLIPATVMAWAPRTSQILNAAGITPGSGTYLVPSARKLAQGFNSQIAPVCPKAKVHVPWLHVGPVPIWP